MDDDLDWDELLMFVRDGRVVPVVGDHLLRVEVDGRATTVEAQLACRLAADLRVALPAGEPRLAEVAFRYLQGRGQARRLYPRLTAILEGCAFEVPTALRQLAEIRAFPLLLTTSFTPLLSRALDQVRSAGRPETEVLAFTTYAQPADLRSPTLGAGSCVYHLFGRASSMPDYVITDEDLIEFLHGLQSEQRPQNLFDYLRGRHLLFLGCGYTSWLARFFIRALRNERFASGNRLRGEVIVDEAVNRDDELAVFLRQYDSQVFRSLDATAFVAELHARWTAGAAGHIAPPTVHVRPMTTDAVFLSYAREDLVHARAVAVALEADGIDVWLDEQQLVGGVDWELLIGEHIRRCVLFIPLISQRTEAILESYFRVEWELALRRALRMASTRAFIIPASPDDTPEHAPNVPVGFRQWQWERLAEPSGLDKLVSRVKQLVRMLRAPQYPGSASPQGSVRDE